MGWFGLRVRRGCRHGLSSTIELGAKSISAPEVDKGGHFAALGAARGCLE